MNMILDPEPQRLIEEHMKRGGYATADDVELQAKYLDGR